MRYTSRRRHYCFRDCTEVLCCTWRVLTSFVANVKESPTVAVPLDGAAWDDADYSCADQFGEALPVNSSGVVDRGAVGSYVMTYTCMSNSLSEVLAA